MKQFPQISSARLLLTNIQVADIPRIIAFAGNPKIAARTQNIPHPYAEKDAVYWINASNQGFRDKSQYTFAIRSKIDQLFIGGIGLRIQARHNRAELGYWLAEEYWNKGLMTEAVQAILQFGFEALGLQKIYATHLELNPASGQVMIKSGMYQEAIMKDHILKNNQAHTLIQYRLTKEEFEQLSDQP